MCGRFTLTTPGDLVAEAFGLDERPELAPRYNIAPTQPVAVVRRVGPGEPRRLALVRWGIVPSRTREPWKQGPLINARSESAAERPVFRGAFRQRRCLVPADGFYEWKPVPGARARQPFFVRRADGRPFAFAGLWEPGPGTGDPQDSCTILTTDPNELLRPLHDRMPLILDQEAYDLWLDPSVRDPGRLRPLLRPCPPEALLVHPVGPKVNDPKNDEPECMRPLVP